jgi:hypothetical protein
MLFYDLLARSIFPNIFAGYANSGSFSVRNTELLQIHSTLKEAAIGNQTLIGL